MTAAERRARFRELHAADTLFVMPNPWDAGSAKLLAALGFEALATTSAGFAWSLGTLDQTVARDELVAHVEVLAQATPLPLNVDSERCYPDDPGGVAETVRLLAEAGAAGCSIEDYDPATGALDDVALAAERVAEAAEAAQALDPPLVLTARAENHLRGVDDLEDTIARLLAYRDAGADCVYAPGLTDLGQIARLVEAVGTPVNVLALPAGPTIPELAAAGVRRVSTGSLLAAAAYGALVAGARELAGPGTSCYAEAGVPRDLLADALG
ncbi:MAG TPA: isocitrate lyase/phosphoenolpyruvate mutase family protein [Gaiellaceae bacterium]|nr:isocitrate lyase/phosphoenolpyruvate mutase family protein [Gaiellaceae bacterium]